jgi:2-oxoisovalerate dehydrogenase E1 component alpha subunit
MKLKAKREGKDRSDGVVCCYFGDGAASEGDFHAALNFAATLDAPVLFFCRNNGFAISTPVKDQYRGDGIVSRAKGYGMAGVRVDGNDIFAVKAATAAAKELALSENRPVLIESMSYRVGHHSTSDDSTRYRSTEEIKKWITEDNPIDRYHRWLEKKGWIDDEKATAISDEERMNVRERARAAIFDEPLTARQNASSTPAPSGGPPTSR